MTPADIAVSVNYNGQKPWKRYLCKSQKELSVLYHRDGYPMILVCLFHSLVVSKIFLPLLSAFLLIELEDNEEVMTGAVIFILGRPGERDREVLVALFCFARDGVKA